MWGSNPRPLAHKTNTLPTELMEHVQHMKLSPPQPGVDRTCVRGLVVMIVACQVMDPGSIPGERIPFCGLLHMGGGRWAGRSRGGGTVPPATGGPGIRFWSTQWQPQGPSPWVSPMCVPCVRGAAGQGVNCPGPSLCSHWRTNKKKVIRATGVEPVT